MVFTVQTYRNDKKLDIDILNSFYYCIRQSNGKVLPILPTWKSRKDYQSVLYTKSSRKSARNTPINL